MMVLSLGCRLRLRKNFWRGSSLPAALPLVLLSAVLPLALLCGPAAQAQTFTWKGGGSNNNWATGTNWEDGIAPTPTNGNSALIFGDTTAVFPQLDTDYSVNSLTFTSAAARYSFGSNFGVKLTLGAGGLTQRAGNSNQQSISFDGIVLGASQTWNINNSGGLRVASPISGGSTAALTKTGTGTLTLLGNNTYSGGTTTSNGVINVGDGDGTGTLVSSNLGTGAVTLNSNATINFNASSSAGNATISNNGSLNFNNSSVASSATITNTFGGSLSFNNSSSADNATIRNNAGSVSFNDSSSAKFATISNNAGNSLIFNDTSSANTATITNLGSIFFNDSSTGGSLVMIANNGGSLNLSGPTFLTIGSLSGAGSINLGSSKLVVGALGRTETISGAISGAGIFAKQGTGTLTLTGNNSQAGGLESQGGQLVLASGNAGGAGQVTVAGNSNFAGTGNSTMTVSAANALAQITDLTILGWQGSGFTAGGSATVNVNAANSLVHTINVSVTGGDSTQYASGGNAILNLSTANALTNVGNVFVTGGAGSSSATGGSATVNVSAANVLGNLGTIYLTGGSTQTVNSGGAAVLSLGANDTAASNTNHIVLATNSTAQARVDLNGHSLTIGGIDTAGVVDSNLIVQNGGSTNSVLTVGTDNADYTFGGNLRNGAGTGTLSLVKVGSGTLTLVNTNTYTGTTTLNGGTLLIRDAASLGSQGENGLLLNSGTLGFISGANTLTRNFTLNGTDGGFTAVNADDTLTLSGTLSGSGSLTKRGAGTLILTSINFYSGGTTIESGTLVANSNFALSSGAVANNGSLVLSGTDNRIFINTISGSGNLVKTGTGMVMLLGNSTYSGGTTIQSGTLAVNNNNALGTGNVTLAGGTLQASGESLSNAVTFTAASGLNTASTGNAQIPGLTLKGGVTLAGDGALTVTGNTRTAIDSVVSEDSVGRTLIKDGAGTLVLTRDNTYTGGTFVRAGTLVVNNAYNRTALGSGTGEGAVTVGRGATLTGTFAISGALQVNNGGTLGIGNSIGHSSVSSLTLAGGSLMEFEIGADGVSSDRLDVTGLLTRSGSGPITFLLSGEHLADGSVGNLSEGTFTLLTFGSASGVQTSDFLAMGLPSAWSSQFVFTGASGSGTAGTPGTLVVTLIRAGGQAEGPEPGSLSFLLAVGGMGVLARRGRGWRGFVAQPSPSRQMRRDIYAVD